MAEAIVRAGADMRVLFGLVVDKRKGKKEGGGGGSQSQGVHREKPRPMRTAEAGGGRAIEKRGRVNPKSTGPKSKSGGEIQLP